MVAAVVLGVHQAFDRGGGPGEDRCADEPPGDVEAVELLGALARELPGERLLVAGQEVQREPRRLEPDVEAPRVAVDAPQDERWLLGDGRETHHHKTRIAAVGMRRGDHHDPSCPGTGCGPERVDVDRGKPGIAHAEILTCHPSPCTAGARGRASGSDQSATDCGDTPRPVSAAAPQRAAKATASCGSSSAPSANVSPAMNESPQP